mgnify:CR=1 FL=1
MGVMVVMVMVMFMLMLMLMLVYKSILVRDPVLGTTGQETR